MINRFIILVTHVRTYARTLAAQGSNNVIMAVEQYKPVLSPRMKLAQEKQNAYGVILAHPGVPTSIENATRTKSVAQIVVRIPTFLEHALQSSDEEKSVYLYDSTGIDQPPVFLGALKVLADSEGGHGGKHSFKILPEVELVDIDQTEGSRYFEEELDVAGRKWTMVMTSEVHQADVVFVILGAAIIFAASLFCALWFNSHLNRVAKYNRIKSEAEQERAEIAQVQATRERQLNEFIAHEVS